MLQGLLESGSTQHEGTAVASLMPGAFTFHHVYRLAVLLKSDDVWVKYFKGKAKINDKPVTDRGVTLHIFLHHLWRAGGVDFPQGHTQTSHSKALFKWACLEEGGAKSRLKGARDGIRRGVCTAEADLNACHQAAQKSFELPSKPWISALRSVTATLAAATITATDTVATADATTGANAETIAADAAVALAALATGSSDLPRPEQHSSCQHCGKRDAHLRAEVAREQTFSFTLKQECDKLRTEADAAKLKMRALEKERDLAQGLLAIQGRMHEAEKQRLLDENTRAAAIATTTAKAAAKKAREELREAKTE